MSLDWFSGLVGYNAESLRLPKLVSVTIEGEVEWSLDKWQEAPGSWSSKVLVSRGQSTEGMYDASRREGLLWSPCALRLSGNPTKFLQGHNVFGPSVSELGSMVRETVRRLPQVVRPPDVEDERWPSLYRSRVDTAVAVDLGGHRSVHEWLTVAAGQTRSRHGRAMVSGSTVYWGKQSRRWTMKAYCKFCELKEHRPAEFYEELRAFTEGHLRLELTLRGPELKERGTLDESVVWEYWKRLVIGVPKDKLLETDLRVERTDLPRRVQDIVKLWLDGRDVCQGVPYHTFRRWRRMVLEELGVDISLDRDKELPKLERLGFDVEWLQSREVKGIPEGLQGLLFKVPAGMPRWRA
jgi:hypothetical protein